MALISTAGEEITAEFFLVESMLLLKIVDQQWSLLSSASECFHFQKNFLESLVRETRTLLVQV